MKRLTLLLALFLVAGCAQPMAYKNSGVTKAQFERDIAECELAAIQTVPIGDSRRSTNASEGFSRLGRSISDSARRDDVTDLCMRAKGYQLVAVP